MIRALIAAALCASRNEYKTHLYKTVPFVDWTHTSRLWIGLRALAKVCLQALFHSNQVITNDQLFITFIKKELLLDLGLHYVLRGNERRNIINIKRNEMYTPTRIGLCNNEVSPAQKTEHLRYYYITNDRVPLRSTLTIHDTQVS